MYFPEKKQRRLVDIAEHYGISVEGAHRALCDCKMNQQDYERLANDMKTKPAKKLNTCPQCGSVLVKRNGKFGEFYGCMGYPDCRYTQNI
jgi:DNA polymerase III alpha subunit (gram-positive type)